MRYLRLGTLSLFQNGWTVLNEGGLLDWKQPSRSFVPRGYNSFLIGGNSYSMDPSTITLQLLLKGSSAEDAQTKLGQLRRALYPTGTRKYGSDLFTLGDGTASEIQWQLQDCVLSSDVDLKRMDMGKTYIVTFTLTSAHRAWSSSTLSTKTISSQVGQLIEIGDVPCHDFQLMWAVESNGTPSIYDFISQTWARMPLASAQRQLTEGETGFIRFDPEDYSAGWVGSADNWDQDYLDNQYGSLNQFLALPPQGFVFHPQVGTGNAQFALSGMSSAILRWRVKKALV